MIGEILNAILQETKALLSGTGATVLFKANFKPEKFPDNNGNFVLLGLEAAPNTTQFPGGLTRTDYIWGFDSYNWEPDAYVDDNSGYSTELSNFIDTIRQHFSLGALGNGLSYAGTILNDGVIYQVKNGTIIYNSITLTDGVYFTAIGNDSTFSTNDTGYVIGTSWLTQGMVTIFNQYGFQFTLVGITNADPIDQSGLEFGLKITFDSTSFDGVTKYITESIPLEIVTQIVPVDPIS